MVPTTVGGVVVLLLLVIPGIWYELLRQRYRPGRDDSTFIEISRILLAGVVISGLTLTILAFARLLGPRIVADIGSFVTTPAYLGQHMGLTGVTLAFFLIISLTMAPLWIHLTATRGLQSGVTPQSAWVLAFSWFPAMQAQRRNFEWHGHVKLEVHFVGDVAPIRGRMVGYSSQLKVEDRELMLGIPLESLDVQSKSWQPISPSGSSGDKVSIVVIRASEIAQIRTSYVLAGDAPKVDPTWGFMSKPIASVLSRMEHPVTVAKLFGVELTALLIGAGVDRILIR